MLHPMDDPVDMEALFPARAPYPTPLRLRWQGRPFPVEEIHLVHERWEGSTRLLFYSVTARGSLLRLRFDGTKGRWFLEGVQWEEGTP
ncbi:MAG: hypothetical protein R6U88_05390 [Candidatus Bipolaricaulota bacterium]